MFSKILHANDGSERALVVSGHPVRRIVKFIVGFMRHSALYERVIGGTADRLVRLAPCAVMVVK